MQEKGIGGHDKIKYSFQTENKFNSFQTEKKFKLKTLPVLKKTKLSKSKIW